MRYFKQYHLFNIMKWMQFYLIVSFLLVFIGPIDWKIRNPLIVIFYVTCYQMALYIGYNYTMSKRSRTIPVDASRSFTCKTRKILRFLIIIGCLADFLMVFRMANSMSPSVILQKVITGLTSPADQYMLYNTEANAGMLLGGGLYSLLVTLLSPISLIAIILGFYFYKELKFKDHFILYVLLFVHLSSCLISAANEGIIDTAVIVLVPLFLRNENSKVVRLRTVSRKNHLRKIGFIIVFIILLFVVLSFFTSNIMGRTKGNFAFSTLGENSYNPHAGILQFIPDNLKVTLVYLSVYMCEGYYGFSLTTMVDWVPMFGTGFSSFIRNNISSILGVDLLQYTYQARVESVAEWGALRNFHSAYTFWANDFSHIGVIFIMFIIGTIVAKYYKKSVLSSSLSAIIIMPFLITQIFYLPLNNKVFSQPASFLIIFGVLIYDAFKSIKIR